MSNKADNEKKWRDRMSAAAAFSGSIESYCRSEGISASSFYYWRAKLGNSTRAVVSRKGPRPAAFVPIEVMGQSMVGAWAAVGAARALPNPRWVAEVIRYLAMDGER